MGKSFGLIFDTVWGSIYLLPTLTVEYDRKINGYWAFELRWLKWVVGFYFGKQ